MPEGNCFMRKIMAELISVVLALAFVFASAGCSAREYDYKLETTNASAANTAAYQSEAVLYSRKEFDSRRYPYFAMLSETEKDVYSLIYEELSQGNRKFECPVNADSDQLSKAVDAMLNDHPEIFWLDNNYGFTYDPADGSIKEITFKFFDFADTPEKLEKARAEFNSATDSLVAGALTYSTIAERELYFHDYICENTEYDEEAPYNQSAYSALVLHRSVCAGYARCFQYLMQKTGAACYYVSGRTEGLVTDTGEEGDGMSNGRHSWNIVLIDGEFYNIDCLWDDTASDVYGNLIYPFFNLSDEALIHHARSGMSVSLPDCNGTDFKYSNRFGDTVEADELVFTDAA